MIHSNGPMVPSGYGRQTELLMAQLAELGHEVAVSCFHGVTGGILDYNGIPVYPAGQAPFSVDVLIPHAEHFRADLVITLMDAWQLLPIAEQLKAMRKGGTELALWLPVDCQPLGQGDREILRRTGATPIAMSLHGLQMLQDAGYTPVPYVPHSVDLDQFYPISTEDRAAWRAQCGVSDNQVIGICAANRDRFRKAWPEQLRAVSLYRRTNPDVRLMIHTVTYGPNGLDLRQMVADMGIGDITIFTADYPQLAGLIDDGDMRLWYNGLDLLSNCSYAEGFGLTMLEATACGTPVLATKASSMPQLARWTVGGEEFWNPVHRAWWIRPHVAEIVGAYRYALEHAASHGSRSSIAEAVGDYEREAVRDTFWAPVLATLGGAR
jgi:glycosyltransferase involved in cell wall biosynthesis